ncbi:retroviral-like aspartic protease family protein [Sabulilitoribacter multivorans]|uniref:Retroviral-like aspartic protease family protein n=1 Tax=Flaviramulus multivorans TaxID=1304750 RepID=A0ABS9IJW9_9FLAO|nr:retropepsin-like aspartic protease [Flaviramulus multivorans]MCF7560888.1 retroviral-like aspartic protease family protein [Flaviramulus multivorans]
MNKIIINLCFSIIFIHLSYGQNFYFKTGTPSTRNYYTEIKYEDVNGKIIIPVTIEGVVYRFLFDTGAPNLISKDLWKKIASKSVKIISVTDANQKKQRMELASIPRLTIGTLSFKNSSALVFEGENNLVFECFNIDGIIGSNLLRKSIIQIQSKNKLLILTNDSKKLNLKKEHASKLLLVGKQSSPYISIKLIGEDSGTESLLFDTGASGFYDLCKTNYNVLKEKKIAKILSKSYGSSSVGMFGIADKSEQYLLKIPQLKVNNHILKNVVTTTGDDDNSRIGSDILKYGTVTLNFSKEVFYFQPFQSVDNLDEKLLGFTPTIENNKLVVGFIWDELLKEKIEFGDEIIEVNGIDVQNQEICNFINKKSIFKNSDVLNIVFKNKNGEITKMELEKI